jgi:phospholipid/cholesterol/gamma-HCH transport system ATP-binding protein
MLIMYDEPFTGLDPISLGVIRNLVRKLNDALGSTSIVVTHDVQEALDIVDYVYYLSKASWLRTGRPNRYAPLRIRWCISSCGARRKAGRIPVSSKKFSEELELV